MSRRAFKPTVEQRGQVEAMIGYGIPEAEICRLIKNPVTGKPIDLEALRKHFATEIATGATKMNMLVGERIFAFLLGQDGGIASEPARVRLAMFYAKTRMGWNPAKANHREHVGAPIDVETAKQSLEEKLDRLRRRLKARETTGTSEG